MYSTFEIDKYNKEGRTIFIFVMLCVFFYMIIVYPLKKRQLILNGKYTIGEIKDRVRLKDHYDPLFDYRVGDIVYSSSEANMIQGFKSFSTSEVGKRYFVLFDSLNPSKACLLHENPAPDSIEVPVMGWSEMPDAYIQP